MKTVKIDSEMFDKFSDMANGDVFWRNGCLMMKIDTPERAAVRLVDGEVFEFGFDTAVKRVKGAFVEGYGA